MAESPFNPFADEVLDSPYVPAGIKRRRAAELAGPQQVVETSDPSKGNWLAEAARSQFQRTANYGPAVEGLARRLAGDRAGSDAAFQRFSEGEQRAQKIGPEVQTFEDADGAGDYLSALGYQAAAFVPDLAASITGAGVGAVAAKGVAKRAARNAAEEALQGVARRSGVRGASEATGEAAARSAALRVPEGAGSAARIATEMRTAREGADALLNSRLRAQALRLVSDGRVGADSIDAATKLGRIGGAAAGQYPGLTAGSADQIQMADDTGAARIALANTGAAALGALPVERFFSRFGDDAVRQVRKNADGFWKRTAKEFGKQGTAEGTTEVAQQVMQLAGQKWANDNIDLLGPEAMNQYLASAVGGFLAGGVLGGGAEAGRAGGDVLARGARVAGRGAQAAGRTTQDLYSRVRGNLAAAAARKRKAWNEGQPPQDVGPGGPDGDASTAGTTANSRFSDIMASMRGGAERASESFDRWRGAVDDNQNEELLDRGAGEVLDLVRQYDEGADPLTPVTRRVDQNPVRLGGFQDQLLANLRVDSPIWSDRDALSAAGSALDKAFFGKDLGPLDAEMLSALTEGPNPTLDPRTLKLWESTTDQTKVLEKRIRERYDRSPDAATQRVDTSEDLDAAGRADADAAAADAGVDITERAMDAESRGNADSVNVRDAVGGQPSPAERVIASRPGTEEHVAAQASLRQQLVGEARSDGVGKNLVTETQTPKGRAKFASMAADPGRVELVDAVPQKLARKTLDKRALLSLDSVVLRKIAELSPNYEANEPGQKALQRAAVMEAFGDLKLSGLKIRAASITPGTMKTKDGNMIAQITPAMVKELRGQFRDSTAPRVKPTARPLNPDRRLTDTEGKVDRSEETGAPAVLAQDIDTRLPTKTVRDTERRERTAKPQRRLGEGDFDADPNDHRLLPREAPEGTPTPSGFVPTEDLVTNVRLQASPYEASVNRARRLREMGATKREIAQAIYDEGVKIGRAEIEKNVDLTDRRRALEIKRLEDPASGEARRYFKAAAAGKYDSATVTERRALKKATEEVDTEAAADEAKEHGKDKGVNADTMSAREMLERRSAAKANVEVSSFEGDPYVNPGNRRGTLDAALREEELNNQYLVDEQHDDVAAGALSAISTKAGEHDFTKETALANALAKAAGARDGLVVVSAGTHAPSKGGAYSRGKLRIRLNDTLTGAERMEVLLHELGHHLVWNEVAKHVGWDLVQSKHMSLATAIDAMRIGDRATHDALMSDFLAWRASGRSSKPYHRAQRGVAPLFEDDAIAFHEWMADNIARALSRQKKPVGIVDSFFSKIATAFRSAWRRLVKAGADKQYAAAPSVDVWVRRMFKDGTAEVRQALDRPVSPKQAKVSIKAAVANQIDTVMETAVGKPPPPRTPGGPRGGPWDPSGAEIMDFVRRVMPTQERQILGDVLNRGAVTRKLREHYGGNEAALALMDDAKSGLEGRIALAYLAWKHGAFNAGPKHAAAMHKLSGDLLSVFNLAGKGTYAERIFSDMSNGAIQRFHDLGRTYDVKQLERRARGKLQATLDQAGDYSDVVRRPLAKFWDSKVSRMIDSGVPALREVAALLQRPHGATGEDRGLNPAIVHVTAKFADRAATAMNGLSRKDAIRAVEMMQRQLQPGDPDWHGNDKVVAAAKDLRRTFDLAWRYMKQAGVDVGPRDRFFPIVFDIRNGRVKTVLTEIYSQPKYESDIRKALGDDKSPIEALVQNLVDGAARGGSAATSADREPGFRGKNFRLSQFIYEHGDPVDIKKFASVQSKDPVEIFSLYFEPMVRNAEYARRAKDYTLTAKLVRERARAEGLSAKDVEAAAARHEKKFGPGPNLEMLFEKVKQQGGTDADEQLARDAVAAALGTYGADGSPVLKALSPGLADRLKGPKTMATIQGLQAYQNARLLSLSTLSSLVDPMGIAVRSGGDFKAAWDGWRLGMKSLWSKSTRAELHQALAMLGSTEDMADNILHMGYGGINNPTSRKVNEFIFKWNGLSGWTRATRYMALVSGHGFLLKHAAGGNDTSLRYLQELGLAPGDVVVDPANPQRVKLNGKTRRALLQFVDEAILRPNSQQVPLWHSDPYMGLVTQYKAFSYAIYDQIVGRIGREMQHGNPMVLLPALAYLPIAIGAEMLRELIQHGADGNPRRKNWGPEDYAMLGVGRTGLLGPKADVLGDLHQDVQFGKIVGTSQIGPTGSQVQRALTTRNAGKTFEDALPGSAAYKRWNDDLKGVAAGEKKSASAGDGDPYRA